MVVLGPEEEDLFVISSREGILATFGWSDMLSKTLPAKPIPNELKCVLLVNFLL